MSLMLFHFLQFPFCFHIFLVILLLQILNLFLPINCLITRFSFPQLYNTEQLIIFILSNFFQFLTTTCLSTISEQSFFYSIQFKTLFLVFLFKILDLTLQLCDYFFIRWHFVALYFIFLFHNFLFVCKITYLIKTLKVHIFNINFFSTLILKAFRMN